MRGGTVTTASTPEGSKFGYVFINCKLTAGSPPNSVALGRPWRPFAKTVFINCEMGEHIKPEGWDNWGKAEMDIPLFMLNIKALEKEETPTSVFLGAIN